MGDNTNRVYSPSCLYLCAYILAQTAKGSCKKQIYDFLGADDTMEDKLHNFVIRNNYIGDEYVNNICRVGTSIWINDRLNYSEDLLERLCNLFNTASFCVDVKAKDSAKKMNSWINEMTGGYLSRESGSTFDNDSALTVFSTVYINAGWSDEFEEEDTKEGIFLQRTARSIANICAARKQEKCITARTFPHTRNMQVLIMYGFFCPKKLHG